MADEQRDAAARAECLRQQHRLVAIALVHGGDQPVERLELAAAADKVVDEGDELRCGGHFGTALR